MSRAKQLTDDHWNNYVGPLLTAAGVEGKVVALCGFIYKSSGVHFYKHAQEDAVEAARGAFANAAAHKAPALCDSEVEKAGVECRLCHREMCLSAGSDSTQTECGRYTPAPAVAPPFTFPPALKWMGKTETEYDEKLIEEVDEVVKAEDNRHRMIELFDVIHVCESAIRTLADKTGVDPAEAAAATVEKNRLRNYYNP